MSLLEGAGRGGACYEEFAGPGVRPTVSISHGVTTSRGHFCVTLGRGVIGGSLKCLRMGYERYFRAHSQ